MQVASVTFTNTYENVPAPPVPGDDIGSLKVTKTLTGNAVDANKEFNFTVTLGNASISGTYGEMTFENGVAKFTLKGGESITATGIPAGTEYGVVENDANKDGYTTTSTGESGNIVKDKTAAVEFVNTKNAQPQPTPASSNTPDKPNKPTDSGGAKTGYESNMLLWITVGGISPAALMILAFELKNKKYVEKHSK